jgi:2-polyprenyl-3-methyl-5-hydroxy-6-metoxy-1,4-benzoquinol methylase
VKADYTEDKVWQRMLSAIAPHVEAKRTGQLDTLKYQHAPGAVGKRLTAAASRTLRRAGFELRRISAKEGAGESQEICQGAYQENAEAGPINFAEKVKRAASSGFFEWPNMVALNWTVASLVGAAASIAEIGGGTGCFAYEAAADPRRHVVCADLDAEAINWARQNRSRPNIRYLTRMLQPEDGPFDLVVAVDVIEHVADYPGFLRACTALAPRALITTPNRSRSPDANHHGPPQYWQHVREWRAGEFYWVLRAFYKEVRLLAMKDPHIPEAVPVDVDSKLTPLIADCRNPVLTGESPCT